MRRKEPLPLSVRLFLVSFLAAAGVLVSLGLQLRHQLNCQGPNPSQISPLHPFTADSPPPGCHGAVYRINQDNMQWNLSSRRRDKESNPSSSDKLPSLAYAINKPRAHSRSLL